MKLIPFLLPLIVFTSSLRAQTAKDIKQIEFSTSARGSYKQIIFTPKEMLISEENRSSSTGEIRQSKKLTSAEWKKLCSTVKEISIPGIPELTSPTMKRSSDGARTSTITLSTTEGKTWSHSFDNENPNAQLQNLMDAITSLMSEIKKE